MAEPETVLGYIVERYYTSRRSFSTEWNDHVLSELPAEDYDGPPLIRSMFAPLSALQPYTFEHPRMIAFGLTREAISDQLDKWLSKFEALLGQLHWHDARLSIETEYRGTFDLTYTSTKQTRAQPQARCDTEWILRCSRRGSSDTHNILEAVRARPGYSSGREFECVPDRVRIQRILDASRAAQRYLSGRTRADLDSDDFLWRAISHVASSIREEARRVSDEGQTRASGVPWIYLWALGDEVVHDWWDQPGDRVWTALRDKLWRQAQDHLPELIAALERTVESWPMPDHPSSLRP